MQERLARFNTYLFVTLMYWKSLFNFIHLSNQNNQTLSVNYVLVLSTFTSTAATRLLLGVSVCDGRLQPDIDWDFPSSSRLLGNVGGFGIGIHSLFMTPLITSST